MQNTQRSANDTTNLALETTKSTMLNTTSKSKNQQKIDKYKLPQTEPVEKPVEINYSTPFIDRPFRVYVVRQYLTQFDETQEPQKLREEGTEHEWIGETGTTQKTGIWWTDHVFKGVSEKEITYRQSDPKVFVDPNLKTGDREGKNQYDQYWKEDWQVNEVTGYKRWNKMTLENASEKNYGAKLQWGEWREDQTGQPIKGERWMETFKEYEDYWERKSETYTEYKIREQLKCIENALETVLEQPNLIRSGFSEYRNNRNYHYGEKWDEYQDGTQHKKIILDDGFGKRTLKELGKKLNDEIMAEVKLCTDENGFFMFFIDSKKERFSSLQDLIEEYKEDLVWDTCNETVDDISNQTIIFQKEGIDVNSNTEWNHKRTVYQNDNREVTENTGKDGYGGEW